MNHFLIETPFGRFAALISAPGLHEERALALLPIGSLDEIPIKADGHLKGYIDTDALTAEGRRQIEEGEAAPVGAYLIPSPAFKINSKSYRGRVTVEYATTTARTPQRFVRVSNYGGATSSTLTDAARNKIADWMEAHEEEIFTPERIAAYKNRVYTEAIEGYAHELAKLAKRRDEIHAELRKLAEENDEATS